MIRETKRFLTIYTHDSKKMVEVVEGLSLMAVRNRLTEKYGSSLRISRIRKMEDPEDEES